MFLDNFHVLYNCRLRPQRWTASLSSPKVKVKVNPCLVTTWLFTYLFLSDDVAPPDQDADVDPDDNDFEFVSVADVDDSGNG